MLKMRIERAPLKESENRAILDEYNRLTSGRIPMDEFVHWVKDNPAGAAWHAILETEEGRIAGHTSVFPLRTSFAAGTVIPAKSEYSFLHENFRKEKIQGYESVSKPAFIILLDQLFKHCQEQGWGPIFASTNEKNQVFTRKVGLRAVEFPVWECLLVLRPADASRLTPNLTKWQRLGLFSAGMAHSTIWSLAAPLLSFANGICEVPVGKNGFPAESTRLSFFEDTASLQWRYLAGQYVRLGNESAPGDYVIAKRGSATRFLRVCQWRMEATEWFFQLLPALVREARRDGALGVRWAVYDGEPGAAKLVRQMRRAGFLCARRPRMVMIHKKEEKYLEPSLWKMNDSLFSFDP
jgi:hypothetical protein